MPCQLDSTALKEYTVPSTTHNMAVSTPNKCKGIWVQNMIHLNDVTRTVTTDGDRPAMLQSRWLSLSLCL